MTDAAAEERWSAQGTARAALRSEFTRAGPWIFVSAVGPYDLNEDKVFLPDGLEAQTAKVFANLDTLLARANAGVKDIVMARIYLVEFERFAERFDVVWAKRFKDIHKPARSLIGVQALTRGAIIEMDIVLYSEQGATRG